MILRLHGGLDFSKVMGDDDVATPAGALTSGTSTGDLTISNRVNSSQMMHADSNLDISHLSQNEMSMTYSSLPTRKYFCLYEFI